TETNAAKELLERSRRMLTLALESSRSIAWEYDPRTHMLSWLDRTILRDSEDRIPASDSFDSVLWHVVPEDRKALRGLLDEVLKSGGDFSTEFRMFARDGSIRWKLGKGELLRKSGDNHPTLVGVTIDVSEMKNAQVQLQELAKHLMQAQEEERKRISRELHDDIGQRVALLGMELDMARRPLSEGDLRNSLERLQASASELGTDLHHISHALHSSKLKHLGLESALRDLCQRMSHKPALLVELNCAKMTKSIPEDNALALYRVAQEALNNVIRHSLASKASLSLEYSDTEAKLVISDNGQGFDVSA